MQLKIRQRGRVVYERIVNKGVARVDYSPQTKKPSCLFVLVYTPTINTNSDHNLKDLNKIKTAHARCLSDFFNIRMLRLWLFLLLFANNSVKSFFRNTQLVSFENILK